ncbi:MAG: aldehyde dehydrogenase family protein, partial [Verrucomicrobiaceae bacterium]
EIHREPRGAVLVIGPGNYPLLLPGVQILQALAAGNGVLFKPAPGTGDLAAALRDVWVAGGLPSDLFQILPEATDAVHEVIGAGVDFVVLTGSAAVGEAVMKSCAERLTPSVMELSGCDAVIICEDAEVELAAQALAFGLRLNGGATCIAPRRVFVARRIAERLEAHLTRQLSTTAAFPAPAALVEQCKHLLNDADARAAAVLAGGLQDGHLMLPLVISGGAESRAQLDPEIFAPVLVITFVDTVEEAITLSQRCAYALGASVFSRNEVEARRIAGRLNAGVVLINDLVAPTADPRIPFGGRKRSGFGVTRGAEGLLTMTVPKVITSTHGTRRPHFAPVGEAEAGLFAGYIQTAHAGEWRQRWNGLRQLWKALKTFSRTKKAQPSHDFSHE